MSKNRTAMSYEVTELIIQLGFPADFAQIVGEQMNTDFTAKQMIGYLKYADPITPESIADEMLGILEFRDKCVQKHITRGY